MSLVPRHDISVLEGPSENVKAASNGGVDPAAAEGKHVVEIICGTYAARIGDGQRREFSEEFHQSFVDARALAFHMRGVDEEFVAIGPQRFQRIFRNLNRG